jgi:NAD(P)-dependent dehydrogenase (short-subunit alcohol dehydrogenase family)
VGRLQGKVAIVTGGAQGVGRGIALAFASEGALVVIADINEVTGERTAAEVSERGPAATYVKCDVTERADVERTVRTTWADRSSVDILVNNAIRAWPGLPLEEVIDEHMDVLWKTGPRATLLFMQECFPIMRDGGGGKIINLGSRAGIDGAATMGPYAASKEAIRALTRVAAREWGKYGIYVNTLVPFANSPAQIEFSEHNPEYMRRRLETLALGRVGDIEADVGRAATFLAGSDSDYISGHTLMVDGGSCTF